MRSTPPELTPKQRMRMLWPWLVLSLVCFLVVFLWPRPALNRFLIFTGLALNIAGQLFLYRHERRLRRRWEQGRCLDCGYDLRGTPDRCPECGMVAELGSKR